MDLPPELKQGIFLLLAEKELEVVGDVFPDIVDDHYFKGCYQYLYYTLYECCQFGYFEGAKLHLKRTNAINRPRKNHTWRPLHSAVFNQRNDFIQILLNDARLKVNIHDFLGQTPLHLAVKGNSKAIVELLLNDPRVDVNPVTHFHETPLDYALKKERYKRKAVCSDIVKLLKEAGVVEK